MPFQWTEAQEILGRTPAVLRQLLGGISDCWSSSREREDSWSPHEVLGHLIHGEQEDWIPRARLILEHGTSNPFTPFDRFAHLEWCRDRPLDELLDRFAELRRRNLETLRALQPNAEQLRKQGVHPALGSVTLEQLLATWVVHDLNHLNQISRALAARYYETIGPWNKRDHLRILHGD
jgi:hypothetical protein